MKRAEVRLSVEDIRTMARVAGLTVRDDEVAAIAERLSATLTVLAAVPDAVLCDLEPAFGPESREWPYEGR